MYNFILQILFIVDFLGLNFLTNHINLNYFYFYRLTFRFSTTSSNYFQYKSTVVIITTCNKILEYINRGLNKTQVT